MAIRKLSGLSLGVLATAAMATTSTLAWGEQDILLATRNGATVAGVTNYSFAWIGPAVFASQFEVFEGDATPYATDPGVGAIGNASLLPDGTSKLPPLTSVYMAAASTQWGDDGYAGFAYYWNGMSAPSLSPLPVGVDVAATVGSHVLDFAVPSPIAIALSSTTGSLHVHPGYSLTSTAADGPPSGVYVLSLSFAAGNLGYTDPVPVVLGWDVPPSTLALASQFVASRAGVPEPGGIALLFPAVGVLLRRRRAKGRAGILSSPRLATPGTDPGNC